MKTRNWRGAAFGMVLTVLMGAMAVPALAADKTVCDGAFSLTGVLSESTVSYTVPAAIYTDRAEKTITLPLIQMDPTGTVSYDNTTREGMYDIGYGVHQMQGNQLVPLSWEELSARNDKIIEAAQALPDFKGDYYRSYGIAETSDYGSTPTIYTFIADGYYLISYDPSPVEFVDGAGGGIENSDKAQYAMLQVSGASLGQLAVPQAPAEPAAAANQSKVVVDGVVTPFEAYTIQGNNYFKLRDIASILSGSAKQFEVTWDSEKGAINLMTGKPYTVVGGEMVPSDTAASAVPTLNQAPIYLNGTQITMTAYTIGGNNYFKLRDIAAQINFGVTWDGAASTIAIDLQAGYTAE